MKTNQRLAILSGMILFVTVLLLATTSIADAQLASKSVVYAWDEKVSKYQNSLVEVDMNGEWVPFLHQLHGPANNDSQFDTTAFISPTLGINSPGTRFAGLMDYGVAMTDTNGAKGFRTTRRWSLVACDRNNDQNFDNAERALPNPTGYYAAPYKIEDLTVIYQNVVMPCSTGNCAFELVTRLLVNLDTTPQDGIVDARYRVGGVIGGEIRPICFYAEAQKPVFGAGDIAWGGNLQARVQDNGGDKTVNFHFNVVAPTAVTLSSFGDVTTETNVIVPTLMLGVIGVLAGASIWKFRAMRNR